MASRLTTNQEIAGSTPAVVIIFLTLFIYMTYHSAHHDINGDILYSRKVQLCPHDNCITAHAFPASPLSSRLTVILHFITSLVHDYQAKCHGDNKKADYLMNVTHDLDRNELLVSIAQNTTGRIHYLSDGDFRKHPVSWHGRICLYKQTSQDGSLFLK